MAWQPTICVTFDHCIHSYTSKWQGAVVIPDPPTPGAFAWLSEVLDVCQVVVLSPRVKTHGGLRAIQAWFREHGFPPDDLSRLSITDSVPPANLYLDARAMTFHGKFPDLLACQTYKPSPNAPEADKLQAKLIEVLQVAQVSHIDDCILDPDICLACDVVRIINRGF